MAGDTHGPDVRARDVAASEREQGRWRMVALLAVAELLGMSVWFAGNAAGPQLGARWGLDGSHRAWLTTAVQLGFVAGTACAALFNLADLWPARAYFAGAAMLAGIANLGLDLAPDFRLALASRFLTGCFLAGVYPPAMKMIATWFHDRRGLVHRRVTGIRMQFDRTTPFLFPFLVQI